MKKNDLLALAGFILFIIGFTAVMLTVVGVQWSFLGGLDRLPAPIPILIKLVMIIAGFLLIYSSKVNVRD